ncbi:MAG: efflux RND transporter permease subunit [gamma proteobacterium symbiont of Bathyaustriella thionipta]|nr:efflux RND transporter permease subunit [gamma proteobacterium symbiont of Bathyaustriella thionipta]
MGAPETDLESGFEWSGEWVVTYETFRDMGLAFAAALILIYILLVWEFGNFIHPAIIMAPIPLTLIGIIPGHWLLNAEFTATSMIGFIALAGIEVRNSILLVDFARNEVHMGVDHRTAVINAGRIGMRPIWVTDLTMMAGAAAIILDPIFEGMAISLLFGPIVAVPLTMIVVPLGCISACGAFRDKVDPDAEADNECTLPKRL